MNRKFHCRAKSALRQLLPIMALLATVRAGAENWKTWPRASAQIQLVDSQFAPDGKLRILFVEDVTLTTSNRFLKLATFQNGSFEVETIEEVGQTTDSVIEHPVRLATNGDAVWAVWRKKFGSGDATIRAARVYPRTGSLALETVDTATSFNRLDACVGSDGLPRVAFMNSSTTSLTVARRTSGGSWQKKTTLALPAGGNTAYREIEVAARDDILDLFLVDETTTGTHCSQLMHRRATEPATWSNLAFGSAETLASTGPGSVVQIVIGMDAVWSGDGTLGLAYGNTETREGRLALKAGSGPWQTTSFDTGTLLVYRNPSLAFDGEGNARVSWTNAVNRIQTVVRDDSGYHSRDEVNDVTTFRPDLTVDHRGVPYFVSGTTDGSALQVSTPQDFTDEDGDGFIYLVEKAFLMDPLDPGRENAPILEVKEVGGQRYLSVDFLCPTGGSGPNPWITPAFEFHTEVSGDLIDWTSAAASVILTNQFTISGRGTVLQYRSTTPLGAEDREFQRVRVVRR